METSYNTLIEKLKSSAKLDFELGRTESGETKREAVEYLSSLVSLVNEHISCSGRGYVCLPEGWIAVKQHSFDALRHLLS